MNQGDSSVKAGIDLIDFAAVIWKEKWVVASCIALSVILGFVYALISKPVYKVSVPYTLNLYSVTAQQVCGGNIKCIDQEESKRIISFLERGWKKTRKSSVLYLKTQKPASIGEYIAFLEKTTRKINEQVLSAANEELVLIQTELNDVLLSTDRVATNFLNAKRIVKALNGGDSVVVFGAPSIRKSSPSLMLILILSGILGTMIGTFVVLLRRAVYQKKLVLAEIV